MNCLLIKICSENAGAVLSQNTCYSDSLPKKECGKILLVGEPDLAGNLPLYAVCSKARVSPRTGPMTMSYTKKGQAHDWNYVWELQIEKTFTGVLLPCDQEWTGEFIHMNIDEFMGIENGPSTGAVEVEDSMEVWNRKLAEDRNAKRRAERKKIREEEALEEKRVEKEIRQMARVAAVEETKPAFISDEDVFEVGQEITVKIGLGIQKRICSGTVVDVEDRFWTNPLNPAEQVRNEQIVSVELEGGAIKKYSAVFLRKGMKK